MEALPYLDSLFREYLLFRGFTRSLQAFSGELATDKGCGFQADALNDLIFGRLIPQLDGQGLIGLLDFLATQVFSRLSGAHEAAAAKLEVCSGLQFDTMECFQAQRRARVLCHLPGKAFPCVICSLFLGLQC